MRTKTKIEIMIVSAYIFSVVLAIHWDALYLIAGSTAAMFSSLALVHGSSDEEGADGKNRLVAECFSFIPAPDIFTWANGREAYLFF